MSRHIIVDIKLTWQVLYRLILKTNWLYPFMALYITILFALQWLFNIDQLLEVVLGDSGLGLLDRLDFLLNGFINIFRYVNGFIPIAMILIALMQSATLTLMVSRRLFSRKDGAQQVTSISFSLAGVGCVACGGSILTPILGLVASSVSVTLAEPISRVLLVIALVLSYKAMNRVALLAAKAI